jgi:hypothetical protein
MSRSIEAVAANLWYGAHKVDIDPPKLSLDMSDDQLFDACVAHVSDRVGSVASKKYLSRDRRVERCPVRINLSGEGWCVYVELDGYKANRQKIKDAIKEGNYGDAAEFLKNQVASAWR